MPRGSGRKLLQDEKHVKQREQARAYRERKAKEECEALEKELQPLIEKLRLKQQAELEQQYERLRQGRSQEFSPLPRSSKDSYRPAMGIYHCFAYQDKESMLCLPSTECWTLDLNALGKTPQELEDMLEKYDIMKSRFMTLHPDSKIIYIASADSYAAAFDLANRHAQKVMEYFDGTRYDAKVLEYKSIAPELRKDYRRRIPKTILTLCRYGEPFHRIVTDELKRNSEIMTYLTPTEYIENYSFYHGSLIGDADELEVNFESIPMEWSVTDVEV